MALDYNYGNPAESMEMASQSLRDIFAKLNDEKAKKLEQQKGRESANTMAQRLLRTAQLSNSGSSGASGISRAMERGTELGAQTARDIQINQNENDMLNRFKALSAASGLGQTQQGVALNEANYNQMLQQYMDSQANRQEERGWSLDDFKRNLEAQKELMKYKQELESSPWYQRLFGAAAGGLTKIASSYFGLN